MEDGEIQTPLPLSMVDSNGRVANSKTESDNKVGFLNGADMVMVGNNRLRQWPHSSRIIRVSRASGGKDRHSKVWTAKGPRDRRVRLSVSTAIQFYDLQDRLGYDQPSKAVEWLIKAAADAINELPSLNCLNYPPETPRQASDEPLPRGGSLLGDVEMDGNNQMGSVSSNNSETSKGSGLSLSRSEIRVKARKRARERTAKEKEKEPESGRVNADEIQQQQNVGLIAPTSSFTQLLTAGISNLKYENNGGSPMDYFGGLNSTNPTRANHLTSGYQTGPIHVGGGVSLSQVMTFNHHHHHHQNQNTSHENHLQQHHHQQHYAYVGDNQQMYQASESGGSDYNLSFSISSSASASSGGHIGAGYNNNRGPLQSNSETATPSLLSYLSRYDTTTESSVPFFLGGAAVENHHQQQHHQFQPTGLQLCYGDSNRHSNHKGKGKN